VLGALTTLYHADVGSTHPLPWLRDMTRRDAGRWCGASNQPEPGIHPDLFVASALAADVGQRLLSGDESDIGQQWLTARELHFRVQREKTLLTRSVA
tara:strand:+ start:305 stop:595 length:291 start_codon:yes stop_codon:yes gene_type:complete